MVIVIRNGFAAIQRRDLEYMRLPVTPSGVEAAAAGLYSRELNLPDPGDGAIAVA